MLSKGAPTRVVGAHGRHVVVETPDGLRVHCQLRGKKNEAVVGDWVRWAPSGDGGVIEGVIPRRNLLRRQDEMRTKSFAANVDQILVVVACEPMVSEHQLVRTVIAAEDAAIPVAIMLNKVELSSVDEARRRVAPYRSLGHAVFETSLKLQAAEAIGSIGEWLRGRSTLIMGASGVGKSSLINLLVPHAQAQVGEVSAALQAGRHTTTTTTWYWVDEARETALIDSPGFQEFGLRHIEPSQLPALMPDIGGQSHNCRFYNCTHRQEPGCAVRRAVEEGVLDASRYALYLGLMDELGDTRR